MTESDLYSFQDYKTYLLAWIESQPRKWGTRSRLARAASCQLAYVSQVLGAQAHFSDEQAEALLPVLRLSEPAGDFFLLLVQLGRASSPGLRSRLEQRRESEVAKRASLRQRLPEKPLLEIESQTIYYSHWAYCAIHMAVQISSLRTAKALEAQFRLGSRRTAEILAFLESHGIIKREKGSYVPGGARIHLGADSPLIGRHHTNWRMRAIHSLDSADEQRDLHYSSVVALSKKDVPAARQILVKAIEEVRTLVKKSGDEVVCSYLVDLFPV